MKTKNQQPNSHAAFLSIDDWQDDQPRTGSPFDNPLWGTFCVIGAVVCLFSWSAVSSPEGDIHQQHREGAEALALHAQPTAPSLFKMESELGESTGSSDLTEFGNLDEALAGLSGGFPESSLRYFANTANFDPSQKAVVQDKLLSWLKTGPADLPNELEVFSIWFENKDSRRLSALLKTSTGHEAWTLVRAMANLPDPVPALISELPEHSTNGQVSQALRQELRNHDVSTNEISRQLADRLQATTNPGQFERIVLTINSMAWETRDDSELKKLIAGAMASAGQNLTSEQLENMNANVATAITTYDQFPEVSDLLTRLSATRSVENQEMPWTKTESVEAKIELARQNKIHPRELLSYADSERIQEFLWAGKLKGNKDFLDLNMNSSTASMSGFSKAGVSLIRSEGYSAIDLLLSVVQTHSREITRGRLSEQFLEKLDILLANKLKDDLRLPVSSSNTDKSRHPASLDLAERLGGKNAALAIAKAGKKKPEVLREFKGMLGAMIALNEPETYGMIVNAWVIHGDVDGLETIGEAIEPQFITRLQVRLKKLNTGDKQQRRVIHFLTSALGKIGTAKSLPLLETLTESKLVGFQKASVMAIKMIHERSDRQ